MLQRSFHRAGLCVTLLGLVTALGCQPAAAPSPSSEATGTAPAAAAGDGSAAPIAPASAAPGSGAAGAGAAVGDPAGDVVSHSIATQVETVDGTRFLTATVTPAPGYHCNMEFPRWSVQIADDAPTLAGTRVPREQAATFTEQAVTFRIPVPDAAAVGDVAGSLRFSVCNDEACLMPTEPVAWTLASAQ